MGEPSKRSLYWGITQPGSGGRQLLFGLSNIQLFLLTLLRTFLCLRLEKRPQGKTESFQNACTCGFHFHFRQVPCLSAGMATIKRKLAYDQQTLTSFFRKQHLWEQVWVRSIFTSPAVTRKAACMFPRPPQGSAVLAASPSTPAQWGPSQLRWGGSEAPTPGPHPEGKQPPWGKSSCTQSFPSGNAGGDTDHKAHDRPRGGCGSMCFEDWKIEPAE